MASQKHTHKYHKINGIWYCSLPDCTHFMPLNVTQGILGKRSICWECGNEFIIDVNSLENDNPSCQLCYMNNSNELLKYIAEQSSNKTDNSTNPKLDHLFDPLE